MNENGKGSGYEHGAKNGFELHETLLLTLDELADAAREGDEDEEARLKGSVVSIFKSAISLVATARDEIAGGEELH